MATCTERRCQETGLSVSYAYKRGCRCESCRSNKAEYTRNEAPLARTRARKWYRGNVVRGRVIQKRSRDKRWLDKFGALLETQGGSCAICSTRIVVGTMSNGSKLSVDHNHKTGKIRGLLCGNCNVGLGHFKDSTANLTRAIAYLLKEA